MTAAVTVEVVRERWRMGVEARALVLITAILLVFGLATVYSATVIVAQQKGHTPSYYLVRQLVGAGTGIVAFAIAAWARTAVVISAWAIAAIILPPPEHARPGEGEPSSSRTDHAGCIARPRRFGRTMQG